MKFSPASDVQKRFVLDDTHRAVALLGGQGSSKTCMEPYHLPSPSEIDPEATTRIRAYGLSLGFSEAELDAVTEGKLPTK